MSRETGVPRQAMLLCAGRGERLRPLTLKLAKPAIRFVEEPLVRRNLRWLAAAGVRRVVVNLHHLPATVRRAVGDTTGIGIRVEYSEEAEILGTAGALGAVRDRFAGDEPFLLVNGDCVHETPLAAVAAAHSKAAADGAVATMVLMPNPDPAAFRPVEVDGKGRVRRIAGEPSSPAGGDGAPLRPYLFAGIHVLSPSVLESIPGTPDAPVASDINRDVYPRILERGELVASVLFQGFWRDLGTPARYLEASRAHLARSRRHAYVDPTARVDGTAVVLDGSVVGARVRIEEGAEVRGSVLLDGARVGIGAWVEDSILGEGAEAAGGEVVAGRVRVLVGSETHERAVAE